MRARGLEGVAVLVVRAQHVGGRHVAEVGGRRRLDARVRAVRGGGDDSEAQGRAEGTDKAELIASLVKMRKGNEQRT